MKIVKITMEFWREGKFYIAHSPELDMIAQGNSLEEAKRNLIDVIEIQFEEMKKMGTLDEYLAEAGYISRNNLMESEKEIVSLDKTFITLEHAV